MDDEIKAAQERVVLMAKSMQSHYFVWAAEAARSHFLKAIEREEEKLARHLAAKTVGVEFAATYQDHMNGRDREEDIGRIRQRHAEYVVCFRFCDALYVLVNLITIHNFAEVFSSWFKKPIVNVKRGGK